MKTTESMSYRQWQKRNTELFRSLDRKNQKKARQQGYYNVGWDKVKSSWTIVSELPPNVISLFEYKLNQGDIIGAIDLSIIQAERGKTIAQYAREELHKNKEKLEQSANQLLARYPIL
jgi:hypothetical protein